MYQGDPSETKHGVTQCTNMGAGS